MIATDIISSILIRYKNLCTKYPQSPSFASNKKGDSFYLIRNRGEEQQPTQIRLSNHGTYLNTWVDREEFGDSVDRLDPAHCVNISIVFINEGEDLTKDCKGMPNCEGCEIEPCKPQTFEGQDELGRPFTIMQYVYSSKCIRNKYINGLAKAIMEASINGKYIDPLVNLYRAAKTKSLNSSTTQRNNNQENINCNTKMNKKLIRLTESDLHRIVKESVNKVLAEVSGAPNGFKSQKYNQAFYEKGSPMRNYSDNDSNEEFVDEGIVQEYMDRNSDLNRQDWSEMSAAAQGMADGSTWGSKIKGMFNPKWKERKQRQADKFAKRAQDMRNSKASEMSSNDAQRSFFQKQLNRQDNEGYDDVYRNPSSIRGVFGFGNGG